MFIHKIDGNRVRFVTEQTLEVLTRYVHGEPVGLIARETERQENLVYAAVTRYRRIYGSDIIPYRQESRNM